MKLTWMGHACFLLEQDGYRVVLDPYTKVEGYPELQLTAHEVLCSHHHFDHDYTDAVTLLPPEKSPFAVQTVATFHDDQDGALRGANTIHVLTAGGVTVAHLGDLGHPLSREQLDAIGPVDGVLVPVGGVYTVDAAGARQVCRSLRPRWVVPMHYRHAPYGLPNLSGVEPFVNLWPAEEVHRLGGAEFSPDEETAGLLILQF